MLLALGGIAWDASLACARRLGGAVARPKPRFGHAAEVSLAAPGAPGAAERVVHLVGSYHVSQQNTSTGRLTAPMLDAALARAAELAGLARPERPRGPADTLGRGADRRIRADPVAATPRPSLDLFP